MVNENIKIAFAKVKEDMDLLKKESNDYKSAISKQTKLLEALNGQIRQLLESKEEKEEDSSSFDFSIGNKGVDNNRQQSTINSQRSQTMIHNSGQLSEVEKSVQTINETLISRFDSLTDKEFATYVTIYELEKENGRVSYADIALRLKLSESSVRSHVAHLLTKKAPLSRQRYFNGRSSLYIKKGFKDPEIISKLLKLREKKNTQTTLFDI